MDIRQQIQRLLDLSDEMRQRTVALDATRTDASAELDAAEYDLRRLVDEIRELMPGLERPVVPESDVAPTERSG